MNPEPTPLPEWIATEVGNLYLQNIAQARRIAALEAHIAATTKTGTTDPAS